MTGRYAMRALAWSSTIEVCDEPLLGEASSLVCNGDRYDATCGTLVLASSLLHELVHLCGRDWDNHEPCTCETSYIAMNHFLFAAGQRYPEAAASPCCQVDSCGDRGRFAIPDPAIHDMSCLTMWLPGRWDYVAGACRHASGSGAVPAPPPTSKFREARTTPKVLDRSGRVRPVHAIDDGGWPLDPITLEHQQALREAERYFDLTTPSSQSWVP